MKTEHVCVGYEGCKYKTTSEKELVKHYHGVHLEKLSIARVHVRMEFLTISGKSNYDK